MLIQHLLSILHGEGFLMTENFRRFAPRQLGRLAPGMRQSVA